MGGATISFLNMLDGLSDFGVYPIIVVPSRFPVDPNFRERFGSYDYKIIKCPIFYDISYSNECRYKRLIRRIVTPFLDFFSFLYLSVIVLVYSPDIIHTNTGILHVGYRVAKFFNIPHVWHIREFQDLDFKMNPLPSFADFCSCLRDSYVIAITRCILSHFRLVEDKKHVVIFNGIYRVSDLVNKTNDSRYFLCASRLSPEKGLEDVIDAFSKFCALGYDFKLIIAGAGDEKYVESLRLRVQRLSCSSIFFVGFQKSIKEYITKATALIVGSYYEGFGRMSAEAAFSRTIVIGRNSGGTKEILGLTGGFRFNTVDELVNVMVAVSRLNKREYENVVLPAQMAAVDLFSNERNVRSVLALYLKIINNK